MESINEISTNYATGSVFQVVVLDMEASQQHWIKAKISMIQITWIIIITYTKMIYTK